MQLQRPTHLFVDVGTILRMQCTSLRHFNVKSPTNCLLRLIATHRKRKLCRAELSWIKRMSWVTLKKNFLKRNNRSSTYHHPCLDMIAGHDLSNSYGNIPTWHTFIYIISTYTYLLQKVEFFFHNSSLVQSHKIARSELKMAKNIPNFESHLYNIIRRKPNPIKNAHKN